MCFGILAWSLKSAESRLRSDALCWRVLVLVLFLGGACAIEIEVLVVVSQITFLDRWVPICARCGVFPTRAAGPRSRNALDVRSPSGFG